MIFNLVPRGEHHEESRGPKEEPCQDFLFNSLTPPLIFNLVPRGEHHEESRGDKEEPRHVFFQSTLMPPFLILFLVVSTTRNLWWQRGTSVQTNANINVYLQSRTHKGK